MQNNRDFEVLRALEALQQNPDMFSQEQADQLLAYAQQKRIPLQFPTAASSSSVMGSSIMDSLLYGLMPNENMPTMVTEDQRSADKTGSFLGKAGSMIITALLAKAGLQGLAKGTGKLAGIANKIVDSPAMLGGVAGGLGGLMSDITDEGPSLGMGMFGGILGSVGNSILAKKIAPKVDDIAKATKVTDDVAKVETKVPTTAPKQTTGNVPNTTSSTLSKKSERDIRVAAESKVLAKERPDYVIQKDGKYYVNTEKLLADKYSLANGSIHGRAYPTAEKAFYAIRSSNLAHTDAVAALDPKVRQFLVDNKDVVFHDKAGKWYINTDYLDEAGLVYNPNLKGKPYDSPLVATNSAYKTVTTKAENAGKYGPRSTTTKTNTTATPPATEPVTTTKAAEVVDTPPTTTATAEPIKTTGGLKRKPTEDEIAEINKKSKEAEETGLTPDDYLPDPNDYGPDISQFEEAIAPGEHWKKSMSPTRNPFRIGSTRLSDLSEDKLLNTTVDDIHYQDIFDVARSRKPSNMTDSELKDLIYANREGNVGDLFKVIDSDTVNATVTQNLASAKDALLDSAGTVNTASTTNIPFRDDIPFKSLKPKEKKQLAEDAIFEGIDGAGISPPYLDDLGVRFEELESLVAKELKPKAIKGLAKEEVYAKLAKKIKDYLKPKVDNAAAERAAFEASDEARYGISSKDYETFEHEY